MTGRFSSAARRSHPPVPCWKRTLASLGATGLGPAIRLQACYPGTAVLPRAGCSSAALTCKPVGAQGLHPGGAREVALAVAGAW